MAPYQFPESRFPPRPTHRAAYLAQVARGRQRAAASSVVVCGLARDLGRALHDRTIPAIEAIGGLFDSYRVVLYENDSQDETAARLKNWADRNRRVTAICETLGRVRWPSSRSLDRCVHMAAARNKYLDEVKARHADVDYVVVLDTDLGRYSLDGILHTLGWDHPWDAVASNGLARTRGRVVQYDAWAWRDHGSWTPLHARQVNPRVYRRCDPPVRVNSAFGGLAVYRSRAILAATYEPLDIEHSALHRSMAQVWVAPAQVVLYTADV